MDTEKLKSILQSSHLNFLIGSGLSSPYFRTLEYIETLLADLEAMPNSSAKDIAVVSALKVYFDRCICKNIDLIDDAEDGIGKSVGSTYQEFLRSLNDIVLHRRSTILNKQINLFTTNIDIFLEKALERSSLEFNDGFTGTISRRFELSNFKKLIFKSSQHYGNVSELPVFNLYKLHGSVSWRPRTGDRLGLDLNLSTLRKLKDVNFPTNELVPLEETKDGKVIARSADAMIVAASKITPSDNHKNFSNAYQDLLIVNPTKGKFKFTTLNYTYYELLRMYSNELERENSVLFVMGFSFADEHVREITLRAVNSNPTLTVFIFAYDEASEGAIRKHFSGHEHGGKYDNLVFVTRKKDEDSEGNTTERVFNLKNATEIYFSAIASALRSDSR